MVMSFYCLSVTACVLCKSHWSDSPSLHNDLLCLHASDMLNIPSALRCLFYLKCYSDFTGTEHSTMCDCIVFTSLRELWNKQYYTIIELKVKLVWGKKLTSNLQCTSNMSNMTCWKCIKMQMCVYLYMIFWIWSLFCFFALPFSSFMYCIFGQVCYVYIIMWHKPKAK